MFKRKFPPECQKQSVPVTLMCLISMLLNGSDIKDYDSSESQKCLTISQLILIAKKRLLSSTIQHSLL